MILGELEMIRKYLRNRSLKKQEKSWELYNPSPEFDLSFQFVFIDQLTVGGHYHCPIAWNNEKTVCNSVIIINLNKRINEEVIIKCIEHEVLHSAIAHCLRNPSNSGFVETVIDNWIQGTTLQCDNWASSIKIRKCEDIRIKEE